jgi:hypothetical protein
MPRGHALRAQSTDSSSPVAPPRPRGRLLFTDDVRREFFHDRKSAWWIRRTVAPNKKIRLGHSTVAWYEDDIVAWLDALKGVR